MSDLFNLKRKVTDYKEVLNNTENYRQAWKEGLRDFIMANLVNITKEVELNATVNVVSTMENLDAIVLSLGTVKSGLSQQVSADTHRHLIKNNGSLIYQQLFNGKIIVIIQYPTIEGYGEPHPPKTLAIYRPEEMKTPFIIRHLETFLYEVTTWEDYDDDEPREPHQRIGFKLNFDQQ